MVKVTFTLDEQTVAKLGETARQLEKPKSQVVRDAVQEYHARMGRLSEQEKVRMLRALDEHLARVPQRSQAEVDRELKELRASRHGGWRR
jgi:metal-responsive CopG/Arc/MetJ family transcriptional regulator